MRGSKGDEKRGGEKKESNVETRLTSTKRKRSDGRHWAFGQEKGTVGKQQPRSRSQPLHIHSQWLSQPCPNSTQSTAQSAIYMQTASQLVLLLTVFPVYSLILPACA